MYCTRAWYSITAYKLCMVRCNLLVSRKRAPKSLEDSDDEDRSENNQPRPKKPKVGVWPTGGQVEVQVPEHASSVLGQLVMAIEGQNCLQERQVVALELLARLVNQLVSIQSMVMEDACRQGAWHGFGSGLGLGQEEMEVDKEDKEKEKEDDEEDKEVE